MYTNQRDDIDFEMKLQFQLLTYIYTFIMGCQLSKIIIQYAKNI